MMIKDLKNEEETGRKFTEKGEERKKAVLLEGMLVIVTCSPNHHNVIKTAM